MYNGSDEKSSIDKLCLEILNHKILSQFSLHIGFAVNKLGNLVI